MDNFERINHEITHWNSSFDKLTKNFTMDDYYLMAYETNWHNEGNGECADEAYQRGEQDELLRIYLSDMLEECISMGVHYRTDNIFRLWYETT